MYVYIVNWAVRMTADIGGIGDTGLGLPSFVPWWYKCNGKSHDQNLYQEWNNEIRREKRNSSLMKILCSSGGLVLHSLYALRSVANLYKHLPQREKSKNYYWQCARAEELVDGAALPLLSRHGRNQ